MLVPAPPWRRSPTPTSLAEGARTGTLGGVPPWTPRTGRELALLRAGGGSTSHPTWGAMLVDLRLHGESPDGFPPPHTVGAAAADVLALLAERAPGPVDRAGGTFAGGKGGARRRSAQSGHRFPRAVVLDASPGARPDGLGSEQSRDILALLARLPARFGNRTEFITAVEPAGQPRAIAQWLAMNLSRGSGRRIPARGGPGGDGLAVPERARRGRLGRGERGAGSPDRLSFVVGGASGVVDPETQARLARLAPAVRAGGRPRRGPLAPGGRAGRDLRRGGARAGSLARGVSRPWFSGAPSRRRGGTARSPRRTRPGLPPGTRRGCAAPPGPARSRSRGPSRRRWCRCRR